MDQAHPGARVVRRDVLTHQRQRCWPLLARHSAGEQERRFVDDKDVPVFVDDLQRLELWHSQWMSSSIYAGHVILSVPAKDLGKKVALLWPRDPSRNTAQDDDPCALQKPL